MLLRTLLVSLILGGMALAQPSQTSQAGTTEPPETAEIRGTVRSASGDPIPRATLTLQGVPQISSTGIANPRNAFTGSSDAEGNFVLRNIPPGENYRLTAERPGYVRAQYGSRNAMSPGTPLRLVAGQVLEGLDVSMTPQAVITGQVTDANGDPMPNVQIQASVFAYAQGERRILTRGAQSTDDEGNYRISGLAAGRYYISAESRGLGGFMGGVVTQTADGSQPLGNIKTFYPSTESTRLATPVRVSPGDEIRGIDIKMIQAPVYSISGTVEGAPATSIVPLRVYKEGDDSPFSALGSTQILQPGQREFRVAGLTAGSYRVETLPIAPANGPSPGIAKLQFTIKDADIQDAVVTLSPGLIISGVFKLEDGDVASILPELPGGNTASTAVTVLSRAPRIALRATDSGLSSGGTSQGIGQDGAFEISNLSNHKYSPNYLNLPNGTYIKQIKFNGQDVTHSLIDLTSGSGGQLEITLSDKPADINGVVRSEKGDALQALDVVLWPKIQDKDRITREVKTAITDQNGGFKLDSLGPGDYYLIALEAPEPGIQQSPDFLAQFISQAQEVKVTEGGHLAVQVEMLSPEAIARALENMP